MFDVVAESVWSEVESENARGEVINVFGSEKGDKGLVIGLYLDVFPYDEISELVASPGRC